MSITMYDSISLDAIPPDAEAVAGYVSGNWPTYNDVCRRWPNAHHLSIAVTSHEDADCLDIETGDATDAAAPDWIRRQWARGIARPVCYKAVSGLAGLVDVLRGAGIDLARVRFWTAHYGQPEHICGSPACGFSLPITPDATQWTDKAMGRNLDQSILSDSFFGAAPSQSAKPITTKGDDVTRYPLHIDALDAQGNGWEIVTGAAGRICGIVANGADPRTHGYVSMPKSLSAFDDGADAVVVIEGGTPHGELDVNVWLSTPATTSA
jgi:hypothetical protein